MNINLENSHCPICGEKNFKIIFSGEDILHSIEGKFNIVKCSECELIRLNPRPSENDMLNFYPLYDYMPYDLKKKPLIRMAIENLGVWKKCKIVERVSNKGNILDIGCGNGKFLRQMAGRGWHISGIEINKAVVESIPDKEKLNIKCGKLSNYLFADEYFDVITMWHVLEHLHYPRETLINARKLLKKGGFLIISYPDVGSFESKIFGKYFSGWDIPRHLYDFTEYSLKMLFDVCGFKLVRKSTSFGYLNTFKISLSNLIKAKIRSTLVRKISAWLINSVVVEVILYPLFFLLENLNLGPVMTCYVKKKNDYKRLL